MMRIRNNLFILFCMILFFKCQQKVEREFYDSGSLKFEVPLKEGARNGVFKEFYENGTIKAKIEWENGEQTGTAYFYNKEGTLETETEFIKGKASGKTIKYYENGTVKVISNWQQGRQHGLTLNYNENGSLEKRTVFEDGEGVYMEMFDDKSSFKTAIPLVKYDKDTIGADDFFTLKVGLWNNIKGVKMVYAITLDEQNNNKDTLASNSFMKSNWTELTIKPFKEKNNEFYLIFTENPNSEKDTIPSIESVLSRVQFYVYPKSSDSI